MNSCDSFESFKSKNSKIHFDSKGSVHDVVQETPCKNSSETNPYNIIASFDDLDDDGNFYIFLGNI